jgi:dihydrodipicolinate synthase/N-acetylneuraminate lyase
MAVNWQGVYPVVTTQYQHLSINFEATQTMIDTIIKEGVELSKFNLD